MEYELMIPPVDANLPFEKFSKKQAKEYFQWHMEQIDHRISILQQYITEDGGKLTFDFSPESLIPLWEWYEDHIVVENKTRKEYQSEVSSSPKWMKEYISTTKISILQHSLGMEEV